MKYKTLFRLGLKLVGVILFVQGVSQIVMYSLSTLFIGSQAGASFMNYLKSFGVYGMQSVVQMGLGLYLFFGGRWVADMAIPGNRLYCHECGYDLEGLGRSVCPECGVRIPEKQGGVSD